MKKFSPLWQQESWRWLWSPMQMRRGVSAAARASAVRPRRRWPRRVPLSFLVALRSLRLLLSSRDLLLPLLRPLRLSRSRPADP